MAYTFTEKTFTTGSTFDSLYADSLDDLESGTVVFEDSFTADEKKQFLIRLMCTNNYGGMKNIEVAKDGEVCMWVQGLFQDSTYTWMNVLVGKLNNSKAWCSSSEFHQANKDWIQSIGGNKFALECIKDSKIDTFFTQTTTNGICLGSLTAQDFGTIMKRMTWEY